MITSRKRLRIDYAPLTVAVSLRCGTPASPPAQVYDALCTDGAQYTPDRSLTPTVIVPEAVAACSDGSWAEGGCNAKLADVKWWANGTEISKDTSWTGQYSVSTAADATRGTLTIRRNIAVGAPVTLWMTATLADTRTGVNIPVRSDSVTLYTASKAEDGYAIDFPGGDSLIYDELNDPLSVDDWAKASGESGLTAAERAAAAASGRTYLRDFPIRLRRGKIAVSGGSVTFRLYRVGADGSLAEMQAGRSLAYSVPTLAAQTMRLDLRLAERATFMLKAFAGGREVARRQFCIDRVKDALDMQLCNGCQVGDNDTRHTDMAVVLDARGHKVRYPGRLLRMQWWSESASKGKVSHGSGEVASVDLSKAMGTSDTSMEVWCEAERRGAATVQTAADGTYLKNADGTYKVTIND